jgi:hypothetical protein
MQSLGRVLAVALAGGLVVAVAASYSRPPPEWGTVRCGVHGRHARFAESHPRPGQEFTCPDGGDFTCPDCFLEYRWAEGGTKWGRVRVEHPSQRMVIWEEYLYRIVLHTERKDGSP